jgi:Zn-dependent protease/tetratricopeptide (TPR) repeat protein
VGAVIQGVAVVLIALGSVVLLMVLLMVQRLTRLRWQAVQARPLARDAVPQALRTTLEGPKLQLSAMGFTYLQSGVSNRAVVMPAGEPGYFDLYSHVDGHTYAMVTPSPVPELRQPCLIQWMTCFKDGSNWLTLNRFRHYSPTNPSHWRSFDDYFPHWQQACEKHLQRVHGTNTAEICVDAQEVERRIYTEFEELVPTMLRLGQLKPVASSPHWQLTWRAATRLAVVALWGQWRSAWALRNVKADSTGAAGAPTQAQLLEQRVQAERSAYEEQLNLRRVNTASERSKWLLFVCSALLFILIGGVWSSWHFAAALMAVVALHEGGHYAAMRLTGYRNVSVFFLPGLGGLATGEKATATPNEKLFVYLAGPVPGIVLAGAVFLASSSWGWQAVPWLREFLMTSLVINYLNLLPVTPLDGGRVLDVVLFARHPRWRFGFATFCCGLLLGAGLYLDDMVLKVVAVVVAIGLPHQWRVMQLALAVGRDGNAALTETDALSRIFLTLQDVRFQAWSFARRSNAATSLLPDLTSRRPGTGEAVIGFLIYCTCLLGPPAAALWAMPQLGSVISLLRPGAGMLADDVEAAPQRAAMAPPIDWNARLPQVDSLPAYEQLKVYLGAGEQATGVEDYALAQRHFQSAWSIAQALPLRDPARIDAMEGLANSAQDESGRLQWLHRLVQELAQPQGAERLRVARAKEQLSYGLEPAAQRAQLLREAMELRLSASPLADQALLTVQLSLANALDVSGDAAAAEAVLRERLQAVPQPPATDRSRTALEQRVQRALAGVDLAWFLIDHGRAADAVQIAGTARGLVPQRVTVSWTLPRQQVLESVLWSHLVARQTDGLLESWQAYDDALRSGFLGSRKLLFHEADRALVADSLQDAALFAQARSAAQEAVSRNPQHPNALCKPQLRGSQANWRRLQHESRQTMALRLGVCGSP